MLAKVETEAEIRKNTAALRASFDEVCKSAKVYQGRGPPMAYFQTPDILTVPKRYVYVAFGMTGEKPEGQPVATTRDIAELLNTSTATFREWLKPHRTLVWRSEPEVDFDGQERWASYWRCIQLDDDAKHLAIDWHF